MLNETFFNTRIQSLLVSLMSFTIVRKVWNALVCCYSLDHNVIIVAKQQQTITSTFQICNKVVLIADDLVLNHFILSNMIWNISVMFINTALARILYVRLLFPIFLYSRWRFPIHVSLVKCLAPCQMLLVLVIVVAATTCSSPPHCRRSRGSHFGGHEHENWRNLAEEPWKPPIWAQCLE